MLLELVRDLFSKALGHADQVDHGAPAFEVITARGRLVEDVEQAR